MSYVSLVVLGRRASSSSASLLLLILMVGIGVGAAIATTATTVHDVVAPRRIVILRLGLLLLLL
jgi:hypothetical protein